MLVLVWFVSYVPVNSYGHANNYFASLAENSYNVNLSISSYNEKIAIQNDISVAPHRSR